jgi:hypothetical protein
VLGELEEKRVEETGINLEEEYGERFPEVFGDVEMLKLQTEGQVQKSEELLRLEYKPETNINELRKVQGQTDKESAFLFEEYGSPLKDMEKDGKGTFERKDKEKQHPYVVAFNKKLKPTSEAQRERIFSADNKYAKNIEKELGEKIIGKSFEEINNENKSDSAGNNIKKES